jgi:AI-2 transport protein TqsA
VSGTVVEPRFMGSSLDLHPVAIMMALVFFGMIWGIVGMFLAVPLAAVLRIVCEHSPYGAPVASLLAGRVSELGGQKGESE